MNIQIRKGNQSGFTLLELMIVLAILATSAVLLFASLGSKPPRMYVRASAMEFSGLVNWARVEAQKSGRNIILATDGRKTIRFVRDEDNNNATNECDNENLTQFCSTLEMNSGSLLDAGFGPFVFNPSGRLVTTTDPTNPLAQSQAWVRAVFCSPTSPKSRECRDGGPWARVSVNYVGAPLIEYGNDYPRDL